MLLPHLSIQPSSVSGIDLQNSDRAERRFKPPNPAFPVSGVIGDGGDDGVLYRRPGRAQPLDKRWLNRVGLRALAASTQLFHQTANA
jgi:hypothetical protein